MKKALILMAALILFVVAEYITIAIINPSAAKNRFFMICALNLLLFVIGIVITVTAKERKGECIACLIFLFLIMFGWTVYHFFESRDLYSPDDVTYLEKYSDAKVEYLGKPEPPSYDKSGKYQTIVRRYRIDDKYEFDYACTEGKGVFGNYNSSVKTGCEIIVGEKHYKNLYVFFWDMNRDKSNELALKYNNMKYYNEYDYGDKLDYAFIDSTSNEDEIKAFFEEYLNLPEVRNLYKACYASKKSDVYIKNWCSDGGVSIKPEEGQRISIFDWAVKQGIEP